MDIIRNVRVREQCSEAAANSSSKLPSSKHRNSLPNVSLNEPVPLQDKGGAVVTTDGDEVGKIIFQSNCKIKFVSPPLLPTKFDQPSTDNIEQQVASNNNVLDHLSATVNTEQQQEEECAVSGRLEIRVIPQGK